MSSIAQTPRTVRPSKFLRARALPQVSNTLGLACAADQAVRIEDVTQFAQLSDLCARSSQPAFVLGSGSNVILPPRIADRLVVLPRLRGIRLLDATPEAFIVEAMAGESWHGLVEHTLAQGWNGLENLASIPGTVGAAPVQNIGAYGVELRERLQNVLAWHLQDGKLHELTNAECQFAYRNSRFKSETAWLIVAVRLRLPRPWQPVLNYPDLRQRLQAVSPMNARAVFDAVCAIRHAKLPDPAQLGNVGSYFKNPIVDAAHAVRLQNDYPALPAYPQADGRVKLAGGYLIEHAGWKGRRLGAVGMHARQALVLVNHGRARFDEVMALEDAVRRDVHAKFGVTLEREPVLPTGSCGLTGVVQ